MSPLRPSPNETSAHSALFCSDSALSPDRVELFKTWRGRHRCLIDRRHIARSTARAGAAVARARRLRHRHRRERLTSATTMEISIATEPQNVQVKFVPPLHEQRRAWVLDVLRRESVTSVGPRAHQRRSRVHIYPLTFAFTGTGCWLRRGYPPAAPHSHSSVARLLVLDSRPCCI